jgi:serine protease DegS
MSAGLFAAAIVLFFFGRPDPDPLVLDIQEVRASPQLPAAEGPVSYAGAVERASPAVVNVFTTKVYTQRINPLFDDPFFRQFFGDMLGDSIGNRLRKRRKNSLGSGVIVDARGFVVTNNHVIDGADEIQVVLNDGSTLDAEVVGTDADTDVAVLRVTGGTSLPVVTLGSSSKLRVGDVVFAIGNPFGVGQTVTMGIVSATGRNQLGITNFENFIQTDAAINPGNSGGALIDAHGNLVGINTAIFSRSGGSQGIGFAIPVDMVRGIIDQIVTYGEVRRGWIGIAGQDVTPALAESFGLQGPRGVLISSVVADGPADRAGIRPGDVITEIDDISIDSAFDVVSTVAGRPPDSTIRVRGWRGGEPLDLGITLGSRPLRSR